MFSENPQFKDFEGPANPAGDNGKPVDGENVGTPDTSNSKLDKKDISTEKLKTVAEITEDAKHRKGEIDDKLANNPDWPPASGNKKSEEILAGELDNSLNEVV